MRSHDLVSKLMSAFPEIIQSLKRYLKRLFFSSDIWQVVRSCWNHIFWTSINSTSNWSSCYHCLYRAPFTVTARPAFVERNKVQQHLPTKNRTQSLFLDKLVSPVFLLGVSSPYILQFCLFTYPAMFSCLLSNAQVWAPWSLESTVF